MPRFFILLQMVDDLTDESVGYLWVNMYLERNVGIETGKPTKV